MEIGHPAHRPSIDSTSEARICRRCLTATTPGSVCERCACFELEQRDHKRRRLDTRERLDVRHVRPLQNYTQSIGKSTGTDRRVSAEYMPTPVGRLQNAPNGMRCASNPYPRVNDGRNSMPVVRQPLIVPNQPLPPGPLVLVLQAGYALTPTSTAAPHFNSKGELIQPPPAPAPAWPPPSPIPDLVPFHTMRPRHNIRLCARHGCAAILPMRETSDICLRCRNVPSQPSHQLYRISGHAISHITMPSLPPKLPVNALRAHEDDSRKTSSAPVVVDDVSHDDLDDLQFLYPEPIKEVASSTPQPPPTSTLRPPLPIPEGIRLARPAPPRQQSEFVNPADFTVKPSESQAPIIIPPTRKPISVEDVHPQRISGSMTGASSRMKMLPPPRITDSRICASPGCDRPLQADSVTSRCFRCVMKDWKSRVRGKEGPSNKRRKTVTWADERGVGCAADEGMVDDGSSQSEVPCTTKFKIRIPARRTSVSTSDSGISDSPRPSGDIDASTRSAVKSENEPEVVPPPVAPPPGAGPSSAAPPSEITATTIPGWDGDLTDLADLSDNIESEMDKSSSDEEPVTQHPTSGLKIRVPARPKRPPTPKAQDKNLAVCTIKRCQRVLPQGYRWKCCVPCRLHHREYQLKRQNIQGRHMHLDYEVDGYHDKDFTPRSGPGSKHPPLPFQELRLTPGARLCSIKNCIHVIPAREEYKWKMCEPCQIRTRNNRNRIRGMNMGVGGEVSAGDRLQSKSDAEAAAGGSGSGSEDIPLSVVAERRTCEGSSTGLRRCMSQDCGMWVDPASSEALCKQCSIRQAERHLRRKRERPRNDASITEQTRTPGVNLSYPEYKCWSALLDEFHTRLVGFLEVQSFYFLYKQSPRTMTKPDHEGRVTSTFGFDGEFSVVALDFDILERTDAVQRYTVKLASEIARVGTLEFNPTGWVSTLNRCIVTRFACVYVYTSPKTSRPLDSSAPATRQMRGELEIAVLPDHTHMLFPGQRTIVRFRLAG